MFQSALDDLLGLTAPSAAANDPWAPPPPASQPAMYPSVPPPYPDTNNDPWGGADATAASNVPKQQAIGIG